MASTTTTFVPEDTSSKSVYSQQDPYASRPIETSMIFLLALIIAACVEGLVDWLDENEDPYFQAIFSSIKQETLVCSLLTMIIMFCKSLGAFSARWSIMLNYAVMTLFFMIIFMLIILCSVVLSLSIETRKWIYFESGLGGMGRIDADPQLSDREELFRKCRERFRETMIAKGLRRGDGVKFSDYLKRVQRHTMKAITDLGWKCWSGLAVWILMNGVRARITAPNTPTEEIKQSAHFVNLFSFIAMVGFITLIIFLMLHYVVQSKVRIFADEPAAKLAPNGTTWIIKDCAKEYLFFGSLETTAQLFQTCILILMWFFSVFVLALLSSVFQVFPWYGAVLWIIFAVIPLVVFAIVFPWTVTMITILNFLGEGIDVAEAKELVAVLEEKERRERTLTLQDHDDTDLTAAHGGAGGGSGSGGGSGGGGAPIGTNDEWQGAPVSLHETSNKAAALDEVAPTFDVRTFQKQADSPNGKTELNKTTRRGFDAQRKAANVTDYVGVHAFAAGTAKGNTMTRLNDVWNMLSLPPPVTKNRATGWLESTVRAPPSANAASSSSSSLSRPLVADEDMAAL